MDSRDIPPQPPSHNQLQPPPGMLITHFHNPNAAAIMVTSTSHSIPHHRLPFGNLAPQQQHRPQQSQTLHQQQQQQQQQQMDQKTLDSLGFGDGSPSSQPMRFGLDQNHNQQQGKKKRGRPRKYTSDGGIALGLAPTSPLLSAASNSYVGGGDGAGVGDSGGGGNGNSAEPPAKRNRGRPPGSSKKQLDALGGTAGVGFTPHVIEVKSGEDIASKVKTFSDQGPRTICILSASGAVSRVTLRQATLSSGTVTYEGRFEIITLSSSFSNSEVNGSTTRTGSLSVALAGPDGRIVGGSVVGSLVAATQVQVIVGSFVVEAKKPKQSSGNKARGQNPEPASAPANMLNFGSASQGPSSESSGENESGSSMHRDNSTGIYGAQQQQQQQQQQEQPQPLHPLQMYHGWSNHGQ